MAKLKQEETKPDYYEFDNNIEDIVTNLIRTDFPDLLNANIKTLVKESEKQKVSNNPAKLQLCKKTDRFYHSLDYILEIERNIIRELDPVQLENLLFRTLSHAAINEKGEFKLQPPDYTFWKKEVTKYGEAGLFDISDLVKTIRAKNKGKKETTEEVVIEEDFDDFDN